MASDTLGFQNPTTTNKRLDAERVVRDSLEVLREGVFVSGDRADAIVKVRNDTASTSDWGAVVRSISDTRFDSYNDAVNTVQTGACYQAPFSFSSGPGVAIELLGSATKTIKALEIFFTKPAAQTEITITKRSAACTGGISETPTIVPLSSGNAAATATFKTYTGAPTAGAAVGQLANDIVATSDRLTFKLTDNNVQPITLSSASQGLTLETGTATFVRGYMNWLEL